MSGESSPATPLHTVLVLDDQRVFAEVLAHQLRLERGIERVEVAFSWEEARVVLDWFKPQVVLLDYDLGGAPGPEVIAELKKRSPDSRVVMVSGVDDSDSIIASLEAGAEAWVGKDARFETLVHAGAEVIEGHLYLYPPCVETVIRRLLDDRAAKQTPTFLDTVSARELEVLRCLMAGMTRAEVAQHLFISPNTVRTHVQHLLTRAHVHSTVALVAAARNAALRYQEHGPVRERAEWRETEQGARRESEVNSTRANDVRTLTPVGDPHIRRRT